MKRSTVETTQATRQIGWAELGLQAVRPNCNQAGAIRLQAVSNNLRQARKLLASETKFYAKEIAKLEATVEQLEALVQAQQSKIERLEVAR